MLLPSIADTACNTATAPLRTAPPARPLESANSQLRARRCVRASLRVAVTAERRTPRRGTARALAHEAAFHATRRQRPRRPGVWSASRCSIAGSIGNTASGRAERPRAARARELIAGRARELIAARARELIAARARELIAARARELIAARAREFRLGRPAIDEVRHGWCEQARQTTHRDRT
jgi:hypothetical protein